MGQKSASQRVLERHVSQYWFALWHHQSDCSFSLGQLRYCVVVVVAVCVCRVVEVVCEQKLHVVSQ